VREVRPLYDVLLSDMAPRTTGNKWADQQHSLALSRRVLAIAMELLKNGGNLYCKVFEGEDFKQFVDESRPFFRMVKIVKPKSSRPESREVFVLGLGFKKVQSEE
jgi:23S rRNA (uridine2552-2'-O)-methyltransferase